MNYKGKKTNPFHLAVIVWALFVSVLLLTMEEPVDETVEEPAPETQEAVEEIQLYQIPENDQVEEADEGIDLAKLKQIENATITAYCICKECCGKDPDHPYYGITASGRPAEPYVSVAVDSFLIPLGSTVYLDYGDGMLREFRADDTGGAVVGAHIDVCMTTHEEALEHGVKTARVYWEEVS